MSVKRLRQSFRFRMVSLVLVVLGLGGVPVALVHLGPDVAIWLFSASILGLFALSTGILVHSTRYLFLAKD